jgi:hypothetical protein
VSVDEFMADDHGRRPPSVLAHQAADQYVKAALLAARGSQQVAFQEVDGCLTRDLWLTAIDPARMRL